MSHADITDYVKLHNCRWAAGAFYYAYHDFQKMYQMVPVVGDDIVGKLSKVLSTYLPDYMARPVYYVFAQTNVDRGIKYSTMMEMRDDLGPDALAEFNLLSMPSLRVIDDISSGMVDSIVSTSAEASVVVSVSAQD